MLRTALTLCFLGSMVLTGSGCMCCGMQYTWDGPYGGCVDSGVCGQPRLSAADRRQLRRMNRGPGMCGCNACGSMGGDMYSMGGDFGGGQFASPGCPNCQHQAPFASPQPEWSQPMQPMHMHSAPSHGPTPEPDLSIPTPSPMTSTQIHPTGGEYYSPPPAMVMPGMATGYPTMTHAPQPQYPQAQYPQAQGGAPVQHFHQAF